MERHSKKIADSSSKRRQVTDKLHKAIEKSKRKTDRQPRDQKKKAMGRRQKADDLENIEITSDEGSFDGNAMFLFYSFHYLNNNYYLYSL